MCDQIIQPTPKEETMSKDDLIADRFARFCDCVKNTNNLITEGEISLTCLNGGIGDIKTRYKGNGMISSINPPNGFRDRTPDLPAAFKELSENLRTDRFSGTALLAVKVFLGKIYEINVGLSKEYV